MLKSIKKLWYEFKAKQAWNALFSSEEFLHRKILTYYSMGVRREFIRLEHDKYDCLALDLNKLEIGGEGLIECTGQVGVIIGSYTTPQPDGGEFVLIATENGETFPFLFANIPDEALKRRVSVHQMLVFSNYFVREYAKYKAGSGNAWYSQNRLRNFVEAYERIESA